MMRLMVSWKSGYVDNTSRVAHTGSNHRTVRYLKPETVPRNIPAIGGSTLVVSLLPATKRMALGGSCGCRRRSCTFRCHRNG